MTGRGRDGARTPNLLLLFWIYILLIYIFLSNKLIIDIIITKKIASGRQGGLAASACLCASDWLEKTFGSIHIL